MLAFVASHKPLLERSLHAALDLLDALSHTVIGASYGRILKRARRVARSDLPVLIRGEEGAGAPLLARLLHHWSAHAEAPLVVVRPAHLRAQRVGSELFGDWGEPDLALALLGNTDLASTGGPGSVYIERLETLGSESQQALARAMDADDAEPTDDQTAPAGPRLIASTSAPLEALAAQDRFERALLEHVSIAVLELPRLRDHPDDIPAVAGAYLDYLALQRGDGPWHLAPRAAEHLAAHRWPGNLAELMDVLEGELRFARNGRVDIDPDRLRENTDARTPDAFEVVGLPTLAELERSYIEAVLKRTGSKIYGDGGAAEVLGLKPSTLQSRMERLGVRRPPRPRPRKARA